MILFALYGALFITNISRRSEFRDSDTMNFVDIAAHIARGDGITQSTIGFNEPHLRWDGPTPAPVTAQAPLYPILSAGLIAAGLSPVHAALAVSALAYATVLSLAFVMARFLYGHTAGLLATAFLLLYLPLNDLAKTTYSDVAGLAFCVACLALLARTFTTGSRAAWPVAAAGACAGLAFATRYALLPLAPVGLIYVWQRSRSVRDAALFLAATSLPIAVLFARNYSLTGAVLPGAPPSTHGFSLNVVHVLHALSARYLANRYRGAQALLLVAAVVAVLWLRRHRIGELARSLFHGRGGALVASWAVVYLGFLTVQRSFSHFDTIDRRLVLPASVPLLILVAGALALEAKPSWTTAWWTMMVLLGVRIAKEVSTAVTVPRFTAQEFVASSERLQWLQDHTPRDAIIVGDDVVDVPFYLERARAFSFSPRPYTDWVGYEDVLALCGPTQGAPVYISLSERVRDPLERRDDYGTLDADVDTTAEAFGPFVASLAAQQVDAYPRIRPAARVRNGDLFTVDCVEPTTAVPQ
ncbi:MAG TPA: glycosyltransferase family 39 protein [Polyangiales bacterium]